MKITEVAKPPDEISRGEKPHNYRILVVDDDKSCAKTTMWILESLGHIVQMALGG
jgi:CheY-like chemotaxis protein